MCTDCVRVAAVSSYCVFKRVALASHSEPRTPQVVRSGEMLALQPCQSAAGAARESPRRGWAGVGSASTVFGVFARAM